MHYFNLWTWRLNNIMMCDASVLLETPTWTDAMSWHRRLWGCACVACTSRCVVTQDTVTMISWAWCCLCMIPWLPPGLRTIVGRFWGRWGSTVVRPRPVPKGQNFLGKHVHKPICRVATLNLVLESIPSEKYFSNPESTYIEQITVHPNPKKVVIKLLLQLEREFYVCRIYLLWIL